MHLAEINIAVPKYELEDPRFSGFVGNLERINSLAATMPGYVWMHKDGSGHAMEMPSPWLGAVVNFTVWESPEQLEHFVWNTVHKKIYERKHEWFDAMKSHHFVMWWIDEGHQPTLLEAKERLEYLDEHGNSDHAFNWAHLPHVKLWQKQQCG